MNCTEHATNIKQLLKSNKLKSTPARLVLMDIFEHAKKPLAIKEVEDLFKEKGVDLATLYRNVEALEALGVLTKIRLKDRQFYYELTKRPHHHHVICNTCNRIEDVFLKNDLNTIENRISQTTKFKHIQHSLEFFGLCSSCAHK